MTKKQPKKLRRPKQPEPPKWLERKPLDELMRYKHRRILRRWYREFDADGSR